MIAQSIELWYAADKTLTAIQSQLILLQATVISTDVSDRHS